ncbi:glycosyltransferase [Spirillospora sp. NPDC127200]
MIGYYVHHHGSGHLHRARCVAAHLGGPVAGLSSLPRPDGWPGPWIDLPGDQAPPGDGATAGGRLHWAPLHHPGLRSRMARIAAWTDRAHPAAFVVDVSAEVAVQARLLGVPTVVMAMRGDRSDPAHRLAYDLAEGLVAPWPAACPEPGWPGGWHAKTCHTGAFSRFDGRRPPPLPASGRRVALLLGTGGDEVDAETIERARRATPGWTWTVLGGPGGWTPDPWQALCEADVVVAHAGQNAVAECAAARRPAVVIPQERPHGEQAATGRALARAGLAEVRERWPRPEEWPEILAAAAARSGDGWARWAPGDGAVRAAAHIEEIAARHAPGKAAPCAQR